MRGHYHALNYPTSSFSRRIGSVSPSPERLALTRYPLRGKARSLLGMKARNLAVMLALSVASCSIDKFPLPDEFDAAFATGQVCAPTQMSNAATTYPVRFDLCLYRCVTLDRNTAALRSLYTCSGGLCQMTLLATIHAITDQNQDNCDARDMVDPPSDECTVERFDFNVTIPTLSGAPASGPFQVSIPYLELEQGQTVLDRLEAGDDPHLVISEEVGVQNYPERQFSMAFDASYPVVATHDQLTAADCHTIKAP
jgi:hypothetical protein